jgi:bifunctional ADP-heptose synthase (sugar kinase/adenylyltransferase)
MAVAMTSGATLKEAATIANHAAGLVCGEVGIVPVNREGLIEDILNEIEA